MAAVILFGLIIILSFQLSFRQITAKSPSLLSASLARGLSEKNILAGTGGNQEEPAKEESLNKPLTLGGTCFMAYSIPAASPDLAMISRETKIYTIKSGDTLSAIAAAHNISLETLLWTNGLTAKSSIKPGQELEILPVSGTKHVVKSGENISLIAKKYNVSIQRIIEFNDLPADAFINVGDKLVIPGGEMPQPQPQKTYYATYVPQETVSAGYFIYPTSGRNWGKLHNVNAVDIANKCGTPIYAAAKGKVSLVDEVGWNRGYGKYMMITHPNGVETLYAHFSSIVASQGDSVDQGDLIGYMGTTGHSTGCHLHFEVRGAANPFVRN